MSLLKFLGLVSNQDDRSSSSSDVNSIRRISRELEQMEPERARYLAAFAYLLGRVAHADLDVSDEETRAMEEIVRSKSELPEAQAVLIIEIAKQQNRLFGHVENFLVTREFDNLADQKQKLGLLDCLFAVSAADESVSTVEDREIRQIASELRLGHRDFIRVRSRYREFLDVLKKPDQD